MTPCITMQGIASIAYRILTRAITLIGPTPTAYHAGHSRVMSSLSRLLGNFLIQTYARITVHLRLLFPPVSGKVLYIYRNTTLFLYDELPFSIRYKGETALTASKFKMCWATQYPLCSSSAWNRLFLLQFDICA